MNKNWDKPHGQVIKRFLKFLNEEYPESFVLKGGTALALCYGSDRFSHDIDLDGKSESIVGAVERFCKERGYSYKTVKDTDCVKRCKIDYGNIGIPLKIEVSYRTKNIDCSQVNKVKGISVYTINAMAKQKATAYTARDKIRDMYDLGFICERYYKELSVRTRMAMRSAIACKGVSHFDYLVQNQPDELNINEIAESFLKMCDKLGLFRERGKVNHFVVNKGNAKSKDSWKKHRLSGVRGR